MYINNEYLSNNSIDLLEREGRDKPEFHTAFWTEKNNSDLKVRLIIGVIIGLIIIGLII